MTNIKRVIQKTSVITDREVDQGLGVYRHSTPCCVGALLAGHFNVHRDNGYDFIRGYKAFGEALGGNGAHVILMLRQAGAGMYPFNSKDWDIPPKEVWKNLELIEELPIIAGNEFQGCIFEGHVFDNMTLSKCNFNGSDFTDASLKDTVCVRADFTDCDMKRVNFSGAYLERCKFREADLGSANFMGATIKHCNFRKAFAMDCVTFDPDHFKPETGNRFPDYLTQRR